MSVILGIESTAHTFGVGIVKDKKILSNVKKTYTTEAGGIIPTEAAKHHFENKHEIYFEALDNAGIKESDITAIAFSQGPGLSPCLLEGMRFAKELGEKLNKPLVPVNHCIAHLEIGETTGAKNPVMLYTSGANTQVIAYEAGKYRIFGETLDVGVGNFIDNFARFAKIGFPGGPIIENLAKKSKNYIELPYKVKGMDIALSGILTNLKQKLEKKIPIEDLAYSMQETVFAMLVETAERALAHTGKKELLLGGGVACNSRLQEMCKIMCKERGAKFFCPERSLLVDNGAMIAYLGLKLFKSEIKFSHKNSDKIDILPRQRTDDVEVKWK
jgi:N6-L-threonylcarbamoyladenine synthase